MTQRNASEARSARGCSWGSACVTGVFAVAGAWLLASLFAETRHPWATPAAPAAATTQEAALAHGAQLFRQNCAVCHGVNGDGNGPAANVMDPKPRDFRIGKYRFVTSANGVPYREDLMRTIKHGLAGTSMPGWLHLSDDDIGALADYVMSISRDALKEQLRGKLFANTKLKPEVVDKRLNKTVADRLAPEDPVHPGAEPPFSADDLPQARAMFNQVCAVCHGLDGKGMRNPEWRTAEDLPISSRNFRGGVFKAGGRGRDIYTRIYAGIPGTPMPSFAAFKDEDIWRLVHFVQNLATPDGEDPWVLKGPAPAGPTTQPTQQVTSTAAATNLTQEAH